MLKEIKLIYSCNIAGYNTHLIDKAELTNWLNGQLKAYVGAKDIGIMGNSQLETTEEE